MHVDEPRRSHAEATVAIGWLGQMPMLPGPSGLVLERTRGNVAPPDVRFREDYSRPDSTDSFAKVHVYSYLQRVVVQKVRSLFKSFGAYSLGKNRALSFVRIRVL